MRSKRWIKTVFVIWVIILWIPIVVPLALFAFSRLLPDVWHDIDQAYVEHAYSPITVYAKDFDETNFSKVVAGMPISEVLKLLGPPLRQFEIENISFLAYSDIGHYTKKSEKAYRQRWLAADRSGRILYVFCRTITTEDNPVFPIAHD
jgi:hypothetical protein